MKFIMIVLCLFFVLNLSATIINIPADQPTIQAGINVAVDGDTVLVQPNTYYENIDYNGKNITVASLFLTTQDSTYISQTIINGNEDGAVVYFQNYENSNTMLCGFTLTNGSGKVFYIEPPSSEPYYIYHGGGIYCMNSSPTLDNLIIENNHSNLGGGLYLQNSSSNINSLLICNNLAVHGGGEETFFWGEGGGIFSINSNHSILNIVVCDNVVNDGFGGGFNFHNSTANIINSTISNNSSDNGGGVYVMGSNLNIIVLNSIFWNNLPNEVYQSYPPINVNIFYSDVQSGWTSVGNIDADPLFIDPQNGDYHLTENSPCIDAGIAFFEWSGEVLIDLTEDEYYGIVPDMGAYEWCTVEADNYELQITNYELNNYPNPFNPTTTIEFSLQNESKIELMIYNIKGQKIYIKEK